MQFNRLSAFTLGVIITAASVGAVTYANAAGDATLKACANKKTGAMRYISKGSCKKTEKLLSWSQMGPQGTPGSAGAAGTNGQNFHVIDAAGRDLGPTIGVWNQGQTATILFDGGLWEISSYNKFPIGVFSVHRFYSDNSCVTPLAEVNEKNQPIARGWNQDEQNPKFWKLAGDSFLMSSKVVYGKVQTGVYPNYTYPCTPSTDTRFQPHFFEGTGNPYLSAVTEVTGPAYTAPFTIVAK
jgi:hypothetical protein